MQRNDWLSCASAAFLGLSSFLLYAGVRCCCPLLLSAAGVRCWCPLLVSAAGVRCFSPAYLLISCPSLWANWCAAGGLPPPPLLAAADSSALLPSTHAILRPAMCCSCCMASAPCHTLNHPTIPRQVLEGMLLAAADLDLLEEAAPRLRGLTVHFTLLTMSYAQASATNSSSSGGSSSGGSSSGGRLSNASLRSPMGHRGGRAASSPSSAQQLRKEAEESPASKYGAPLDEYGEASGLNPFIINQVPTPSGSACSAS